MFDKKNVATPEVMLAYAALFEEKAGKQSEKLVLMDGYYSHIQPETKTRFRNANALLHYPPGGLTDIIQVNDRTLNQAWKDYMKLKIEEHMEDCWDDWYVEGVSISDRRILLTQLAAEAWIHVCSQPDLIRKSFEVHLAPFISYLVGLWYLSRCRSVKCAGHQLRWI